MKFRTFYDNFGESEHKDIHAETFTEPSLTDTSPSSFEPIDVKVARILRGEILPSDPTYYDVNEKMSLEDAFETEDPTEDEMFDLADATELSEALRDEIIQSEATSNKTSQQNQESKSDTGQGQTSEASANAASGNVE